MRKIVLFYCFTPLTDPDAVRLWQKTLCESRGLKGRIIISRHGINGVVGGEMADVKQYVKQTRAYEPFRKTDFKWSNGLEEDFPRLSVKVRDEIVTFGVPDEVKVDEGGVVNTGVHLSPGKLHQLVDEHGDDVVFFDGRNSFEARIGRFKDAVVPPVDTTRDFVDLLDSGRYDDLKKKKVVTYCTGGIRCEILTSLMKNRGFEDVYQLDGGIVRYGESFGNTGLWEGSLYVFDGRVRTEFGDGAKVLANCDQCGVPASDFGNCARQECHAKIVLCPDCLASGLPAVCGEGCAAPLGASPRA